MLEKLRLLLVEQKIVLRLENPERGAKVTIGLRQLQIAMFISQWLIFGLLILILARDTPRVVAVSGWFFAIAIPLPIFVAVFSELAFREEPSFTALLRLCIQTAVSSSIPAMLAALAWLFEGLTLGVAGLFGSSLIAFVVCWVRLELLAGLVPQIK